MSSDRDTPPALPTLAEIEAMEALLAGFSDLTFSSACGPDDGADGVLIAEGDTFERDIVAFTSGLDDCAAEPLMRLIASVLNAAPSLLAAAREAVRAARNEADQNALLEQPALPTLAEIEAMEALLGTATPRPWSVSERGGGLSWDVSDASDQCLHDGYRGGFDWEADADSIVALRNAAPSLFAAAREAVRLREELARVRADLDKAENAGLTAAMFALREAPLNPSDAVGMVRLVSVDPLKTEPMVLHREQVVGLFEALERAAAPLLTGKFRTAYEAVRRYEEHDGLVAERDAALRELARVNERLEQAETGKGGAGA